MDPRNPSTVVLRCDEIAYLNDENWTKYEDVIILSENKKRFGFNRCLLASLSSLCKRLFLERYDCPMANLDEDIYISSDFSEIELVTLQRLFYGVMESDPSNQASFRAIGLDLSDVVGSFQKSLLVKHTMALPMEATNGESAKYEPVVKMEIEDVNGTYFSDDNLDIQYDFEKEKSEGDEDAPLKKTKKKTARKKKKSGTPKENISPKTDQPTPSMEERSFCPACGKNCMRPRDFYYHHKHEGPHHKVGTCAFCSEKFHTWEAHKDHLDNYHGGVVKLPCGQCGLNFFDSEKEKSGHRSLCKFFQATTRLISYGPDKIACTVCAQPIPNSNIDIRIHLKQDHSGMGEPCPHCGDVYFNKKTLDHHVRFQHTAKEAKSFACDQCDKTFAIKSLLEYHKVANFFLCSMVNRIF